MTLANEVEKRPAVRKAAGASGVAEHHAAAERDRLRMMLLIRRFEERTVREYASPRVLPDGTKESKIGGFCHVYSGQEAIAVGIAAIYQKGKDALVNGYRCHGHSLALGMSPRTAMAELFGRATGCSKGKGGSMHFFDAQVGNMGGHGIVGGHIPLGLGFAFAQGYKKTGGVTFCLFGDGAVNQGTFHESFNMATLLKAPVIFIVENNGVAMGTQVERHSATKDLAERGSGYNMPHRNIDGNDVDVVIRELSIAADRARKMEGPSYIVANTFRFRGHSMSDPLKYRTKEEQERARLRDPIGLYATHLHERGFIDEELFTAIKEEDWSGPMLSEVAEEVEQAIRQAESDPNPPLEDRFNDALAEEYPYQPK
jgi:pyruvate dehydrogenase E1 component alpha subunit